MEWVLVRTVPLADAVVVVVDFVEQVVFSAYLVVEVVVSGLASGLIAFEVVLVALAGVVQAIVATDFVEAEAVEGAGLGLAVLVGVHHVE